MKTDLDEKIDVLLKSRRKVTEANKVIGIWSIWLKNCPIELKIKVVKYVNTTRIGYDGRTNYLIQNPQQIGPYSSACTDSTPEDAFMSALDGFLNYYDSEKSEKIKYVLDENW